MSQDTTHNAMPDANTLSGVVALPAWGVIRAQGADAPKFLHGQLTQDFSLLGQDQARLAAFCSPKGRMLSSFLGIKVAADDVLLLCPTDTLAAMLKRLSMFVMRAQCRLSDASADWSVWGVAGEPASGPSLAHSPWQVARAQEQLWVRLYPGAGVQRALVLAPAGSAAPVGPALPLAVWDWLEVRSAVVPVTAALSEALVPQMLNYESVGGVNFKKGCYPGQEVVARSQFRGTLKRRAHLFHSDNGLSVGSEVFHSDDAEQPCGTVAACAPHPNGGFDALVSLQLSALESGSLHAGSVQGPALRHEPLPYELLADV
ncbi:MAG: YgfZ/GcvT domain-containing protein [Hydrogenophaga sp.]